MKNNKQEEILDKSTRKVVLWFDKKNGKIIGEEELGTISIKELKRIFSINNKVDPYMIDAYNIDYNHVKYVKSYLSHEIDLNRYDYSIHVNNK